MERKLIINAAVCDVRGVSEETLKPYGSLEINAGVVISSPGAREIMAGIRAKINTASTLDVPEGAILCVQNGAFEIKAGQRQGKPTVLIVNGKLVFHKGAEEALEDYPSILVNGQAVYPESLAGYLGGMNVNGSTVAYPDEAVLLKNRFVVDRVFILRAKDSPYFAQRSVILADRSLDVKALREKGARFLTRKAVIAEELLEEALPLFPEETDIAVIPEGLAYVQGDQELEEGLIRRYGEKLYIDGGLHIPAAAAQALDRLERVVVLGKVTVTESMLERFLALKPEYRELAAYRGVMITDRSSVQVDGAMISQNPEGMTFADCAMVALDGEISPETIREKLRFEDCGMIRCSPEQRGAVEQVSGDVGMVLDREAGSPFSGLFGGEGGEGGEGAQAEVINSAMYTL